MIFCVDFDGTCVTHRFPYIGDDIGAVKVLRRLVDNGHQIILFTMRDDKHSLEPPRVVECDDPNKSVLHAAVKWFEYNKIPLYGINENPDQKTWTSSSKPYAHVYIDDAGFGVPLVHDSRCDRPYVDWKEIELRLESKGILK